MHAIHVEAKEGAPHKLATLAGSIGLGEYIKKRYVCALEGIIMKLANHERIYLVLLGFGKPFCSHLISSTECTPNTHSIHI